MRLDEYFWFIWQLVCHSDVIFAVYKVWLSRIDYVCLHTYTYTMEYDVITNFISWRRLLFFVLYHFFFRYLNTKSRQMYQHEFLVAGWNALIYRYVFYKLMVHQLNHGVILPNRTAAVSVSLQGSATYQHLSILCTEETVSVCHTNGIVHVWSWAVQSKILNFMPLRLSVGHNLSRRLWFLPHSGFELILFLCDVWTFQWWSCWTLPRAESATRDKTLEVFSAAKYFRYSLFPSRWFFCLFLL